MNKKVLKTMIALVLIFLVGLYVLKIFFPGEFVLAIENDKIVKIGDYIDNNDWARYLFGIFTSFVTYTLYCSATCRRWFLSWWHYLVIFATIGVNLLLTIYDINLYTAFSISSFVLLPTLFGCNNIKNIAICYPIHLFSQSLTLSIRNITLFMTYNNALTRHVVGMECWLWLILLYFLFNYKYKKEV